MPSQQARVVCKAVRRLHPDSAACSESDTHTYALHEADGFSCFPCGRKWNGPVTEWVGGFHTLLWLWYKDRDMVYPQLVEEFILLVSSGSGVGEWGEGSEWMKLLPCGPKRVSSQASAICIENWEEGKERVSAFDPTWKGKLVWFYSITFECLQCAGHCGRCLGYEEDRYRCCLWEGSFEPLWWSWSYALNYKS